MANLRRHNPNEPYYPLDNSAVFIASVAGKASPYIFRVSCELDHVIYLPALEEAFKRTIARFPWFATDLRPGVFWYYLEPLRKGPRLMADSLFPVEYHHLGKWGSSLFRVRPHGSRIACEFHHVLTDGTGAIEFLKTLVCTYLSLRGVDCADWEGVVRPDSPIEAGEYEDAYAGKVRKEVPIPGPLPEAFHLPGRRLGGGAYRVTTGTASVAAALQAAKARGVSLTELLAAAHLFALQSVAESSGGKAKKALCIQIPVNLRRMYPSRSMRNFFLFVPLGLDLRMGHYELEEIVTLAHYEMRLGLTKKEMDRQIRRNVGGEELFLSRIFPLAIKDAFLGLAGRLAGDKPFSGSLSNLQQISLPQAFASRVRRFDFLPSRSAVTGANIGVVSWGDKLSVTVGSLAEDREFERAFFRTCVDLGIGFAVESNI